MALASYFTVFATSFTNDKPDGVAILENDKIRIVTNDKWQYTWFVQSFAKDSPFREKYIKSGAPIQSMVTGYTPVLTFGDPTSSEGNKAIQAALNVLLPAKYDEIVYDGSK